MINHRVTAYIKVNQKKGFNEEQIRESLKSGGWNEQDITDSFNHVNQKEIEDNSVENITNPLRDKKNKQTTTNYTFIVVLLFLFILFGGIGYGFYAYFQGNSFVTEKVDFIKNYIDDFLSNFGYLKEQYDELNGEVDDINDEFDNVESAKPLNDNSNANPNLPSYNITDVGFDDNENDTIKIENNSDIFE